MSLAQPASRPLKVDRRNIDLYQGNVDTGVNISGLDFYGDLTKGGAHGLAEYNMLDLLKFYNWIRWLYVRNQTVTLSYVGSGGNLGIMRDNRMQAGDVTNHANSFRTAGQTPDISSVDVDWSKIQANFPLSKLYLAGRGMNRKMKNLDINNVEIVGEVHSAKDFIVEHDIMIVPLLSGSGMRVKLIEGMALGKTIITTSIGAEGIEAEDNQHLIIADTPEEFALAISKCLNDTPFKESIGLEAQRLIASKYSNKSISSRLIYFFDQLIHASA